MKVGIISDTHDNLLMISRAVELFQDESVDLVIHCGDHVAPFTPIIWQKMGIEILAVYGNNDGDTEFLKKKFSSIGRIFPRPHEIILQGKKILVMHEPDNLQEIASSGRYDYVLYGHTHRAVNRRVGETLILNPGEGCGWITGRATAMILDIKTGQVTQHTLGQSPIEAINP